MKNPARTEPQRLTKPAALGLGERLRRLRVAAGLTQGELAGRRFSKEYVSQIERGKTRPTAETVEWLAQQLGVDASFLANGVSTDERGRVEGGLARAEALIRSDQCPQALEVYDGLRSAVLATGSPELEVRALTGEARARGIEGDVRSAIPLLERARGLSEGASFSDVERAEREGHWVLARKYAEQAKSIYEDLAEHRHVGRLHNNIGGLTFTLGKPDEAIPHLKEAFRIALELGNDADAAQAVSSLAQVHLRTGHPEQAEEQSRHALQLLDGRVDFLDEIGNAQLVLGRSLLEQGRLDDAEAQFRAADATFEQLSSVSHRAAAWVALGDLATRRGDDREAAHVYRRAAEALQDFRF